MAFVLKCERPWKTPLVLYFYPRLCTVSETAKVVPAIGEDVTPRSTISVPRTEYVLLTLCMITTTKQTVEIPLHGATTRPLASTPVFIQPRVGADSTELKAMNT